MRSTIVHRRWMCSLKSERVSDRDGGKKKARKSKFEFEPNFGTENQISPTHSLNMSSLVFNRAVDAFGSALSSNWISSIARGTLHVIGLVLLLILWKMNVLQSIIHVINCSFGECWVQSEHEVEFAMIIAIVVIWMTSTQHIMYASCLLCIRIVLEFAVSLFPVLVLTILWEKTHFMYGSLSLFSVTENIAHSWSLKALMILSIGYFAFLMLFLQSTGKYKPTIVTRVG